MIGQFRDRPVVEIDHRAEIDGRDSDSLVRESLRIDLHVVPGERKSRGLFRRLAAEMGADEKAIIRLLIGKAA